MNCLIIGGAGFIGSHVADALLAKNHHVRIFDRHNVNTHNIANITSRIDLACGDFLNEDDLRLAVSGMDIVVHLVSMTLPKSSNDNMLYDVETNIAGTLRLLNIAKQEGVRKIVFASSGGTIYGTPQAVPIPETHPTEPLCAYGVNKLTIEKYLQLYNHLFGLDYVILRIANPYGERQDYTSGLGAITTFLWQVISGNPITIWGDGSVARDYLYVSDVADAFTRVIEKPTPSKLYNIGSGNAFSLNEIIDVIRTITGYDPAVTYTDARKLDVPINCLDINKAVNELEWIPKISLEDGISRVWKHFKETHR